MIKNLRRSLILLILGMTGCAGFNAQANDPGVGDKPAFFNQTSASQDQLQEQWRLAQQQIAQAGFNLNMSAGSPPSPPDARAMDIQPHGVTVISVPDVPISQLISIDPRWATHQDPSGTIMCSGQTVHSCTDVNANTIRVAASLVPGACQYEFEIIILNALGYDVRYM
jgi:hypothetical protein